MLNDLAALPLEAQRSIAELARAANASTSAKPRARVIIAARFAPEVLAESGALAAELCDAFPHVLSAPPLRARREDLPSLVLLALDQAARVLGRTPVGIDAEAQARLLAHDFRSSARAASRDRARGRRCDGPRMQAAGIALALG